MRVMARGFGRFAEDRILTEAPGRFRSHGDVQISGW